MPRPTDRTGPESTTAIRIRGARQNNLKNVDVEIPRASMTVITGVSGSGKSSLAMETLYSEGQRRYLEGVSAYARRFLERWPRSEVDAVEGISPAVALDQRTGSRNARSTVGTSTEIHDYLRLLFARVGRVHCRSCGEEVRRWTISGVAGEVGQGPSRRVLVSFPHRPGPGREAEFLRRRGYLRRIVDGEVVPLEDAPARGTWTVLQDRLRSGDRNRLMEALEAAFREGEGTAVVQVPGEDPVTYRLGRVCAPCSRSYPEPTPQQFSFNSPVGACPECRGFGYVLGFDLEKIVPDEGRSIEDGAIAPWAGRWRGHFLKRLESCPRTRRIPRRRPWRDLDPGDREVLVHGTRGFTGVMQFLARLEGKSYKAGARFLVKRYQSQALCPACRGTRLRPEGLSVRLSGRTLPEWCAEPVDRLQGLLDSLDLTGAEREGVAQVLAAANRRISVLERVGLGYLSLDRLTRTLSGGESQRIELAQALGAGLVGSLYVLDEPTVGLHPRDTHRLLEVLQDLRQQGNTVVVVEHDLEMIRAADWMIDLGPAAGRQGGELVYCGPVARRLQGPPSPTAELLRDRRAPSHPPLADPRGWIRVRRAVRHNLKQMDVDFPWGVMAGVCGVSGSGKSTLVTETLAPLLEALGRKESGAGGTRAGRRARTRTIAVPDLGELRVEAPLHGFRVVDQSPLGRSARSIPASFVGAWAGIRGLFASHPESLRRGLGPGAFSFNVKGGRCEACRGEGVTTVDMDFMADIRLPCEVCSGSRFSDRVLDIRYRGLSITQVLDLTVDEALLRFRGALKVTAPLRWMERVGLGYLRLGQPADTLSGGEAQRLKLVRELSGKATGQLLILDEPTVGLHGVEVARLVRVLRLLVDAGNSVLIIEHHTGVLADCDWLVELGPEGGEGGGEVIVAGPPEVVARAAGSRIGPHLAPALAAGRNPGSSKSAPNGPRSRTKNEEARKPGPPGRSSV